MARVPRNPALAWPDALLKPGSVGALVGVSESTWRCLWPILAAHFGLHVYAVCGPKFRLTNVLEVMEHLRERGLSIVVRKADRKVHIGDQEFVIASSCSGCSGRGRRRAAP